MTPDKDGARGLYRTLRAAFPDFHADIHWQAADGELVTTYKTYHGTHEGTFLGIAPTGRKIHFETVDVMRVHNGKITEHWGVANLFSLIQQLGAWPSTTQLNCSHPACEERRLRVRRNRCFNPTSPSLATIHEY
jgi:predicted SnoaL-like aldol condensation-catalyzing enzyme